MKLPFTVSTYLNHTLSIYMTINKNYGLDLTKEIAEQSSEDWLFSSASQKCLAQIPEEEREKYLPAGEVQKGAEDTMDCASRGPINILETKFTWLLQKKLLRYEVWLREKGYVLADNTVKFADANVAINSGTTPQGNSLKAPLDAIYRYGLVPKYLLPLEPWMTWEDYHNPKRITSVIRTLEKEWIAHFTINYEKVMESDFAMVLAQDTLDVAGYAWPEPIQGEYPRTNASPNHVFMIYKRPKYYAFDNYVDAVDGDFIKKLAPDFDCLDYGYRLFITEKEIKRSRWSFFRDYLQEIFK